MLPMKKMQLLIHTALPIESKGIRKYLNLEQIEPTIYANDSVVLAISGIGAKKTKDKLQKVFESYTFSKALNFGMAASKNKNLSIGTLCCATHKIDKIPKVSISSTSLPAKDLSDFNSDLVDMEAQTFKQICALHVKLSEIYIFKVVSDYGTDAIPTKAFVQNLLQPHIKKVFSHVI